MILSRLPAFFTALCLAVPAASAELIREGSPYHDLGTNIETMTGSGMALIAVIIIILAAAVVLSALKMISN